MIFSVFPPLLKLNIFCNPQSTLVQVPSQFLLQTSPVTQYIASSCLFFSNAWVLINFFPSLIHQEHPNFIAFNEIFSQVSLDHTLQMLIT